MSTCLSEPFFVYLLHKNEFVYEERNKRLAEYFAGMYHLGGRFCVFINPYNIVPGGVYGASIVLHNLFPSVHVGTFGVYVRYSVAYPFGHLFRHEAGGASPLRLH